MKFFLTFAFGSVISIFLISCSNNDDGVTVGGQGNCSASWKVNGADFNESNLTICVYIDNTLNLSASAGGGDFLLQIDPITAPGTYMADPTNQDLNVIILLQLSDGRQIGSADAQVIVTELSSSKAKGTFSGNFFDITDTNLTPEFSVTDGKFESSF